MVRNRGFTIPLILCLTIRTLAQELPSNFEFKRETGQGTGVPYFILIPRLEAMTYDALRGSTFEALGALVQPERNKYGLLFFNAKEEYQLERQKDKGVILQIDNDVITIPEYTLGKRDVVGRLKVETASIVIDKGIFEKLIRASDVIIRVGVVTYNLDQDNIDALRYYAAVIAKDIERRRRQSR